MVFALAGNSTTTTAMGLLLRRREAAHVGGLDVTASGDCQPKPRPQPGARRGRPPRSPRRFGGEFAALRCMIAGHRSKRFSRARAQSRGEEPDMSVHCCRDPFHCIVPPHMLRVLEMRGDARQTEMARELLSQGREGARGAGGLHRHPDAAHPRRRRTPSRRRPSPRRRPSATSRAKSTPAGRRRRCRAPSSAPRAATPRATPTRTPPTTAPARSTTSTSTSSRAIRSTATG